MATCLLDSDIVIDALNGKRGRKEALEQLIRQGDEMSSCSITITEVYAGLRRGEEAKSERLLRSLTFYPITWELAKQAGELQNSWRAHGRTLALPDVTIAAVALRHHLVLITANTKDFPMPELQIHPLPG